MTCKRILCFCLALLLLTVGLLSLTACNDEGYYKPIKSSKYERRVILEFGETEVKLELFRYLFMSRIDDFDNGDRTAWSGPNAATLWQNAVDTILPDICEIYAVFEVARKWGIDPEGENIETFINQHIKLDIEGGESEEGTVTGYGSVDAYKAALAETYCTDAVRRLLYRYVACLESLNSFIVDNHAKGEVTVTDEQLTAFLSSGNVAHINRVFVPFESWVNNREAALEHAQLMRSKLLAATDYKQMVDEVFKNNISDFGIDPAAGWWFGRLSASERDYPDYYKAIFSATEGSVSDIIEERDGFYIVYGMSTHADLTDTATKDTLIALYLEEMYWGEINAKATEMKQSISYKDAFGKMTASGLLEGK